MNLFNDTRIEGRSCGECDQCCTIMAIKDTLNKPNYTPCQHLNVLNPEGHCGIYEDRPAACKGFKCLWLSGDFGRDIDRPDKLGLMAVAFEAPMGRYIYAITLWAKSPEILKEPKIKYMLKKIAEVRPVIIRSETTYQIYGRREDCEAIEAQMQKVNGGNLDIIETQP